MASTTTTCGHADAPHERRAGLRVVATLDEMAMAPPEHRAALQVEAVRAAELARLREVERVALEFCARCERGEIRSVATYERFRVALAGCGVNALPARGQDAALDARHDDQGRGLVREARGVAQCVAAGSSTSWSAPRV